MKSNYDIFLAGSKSLDSQRNLIKATIASRNATTRLNVANSSDRVIFSVFTYENFMAIIDDQKGKQEAYNVFIKDRADLAIFILDGTIGEKTREEFRVAYESLTKSPRKAPGIIVFSKTSSHNDPGIIEIRSFLSSNNQYYIEYNTDAEIPGILDNNLNKFIQDQQSKQIERRKRRWKWFYRILFILLALFFVFAIVKGIHDARLERKENARKEAINSAQRVLDRYHQSPSSFSNDIPFQDALNSLNSVGIADGEIVRQLKESLSELKVYFKDENLNSKLDSLLSRVRVWLEIPDPNSFQDIQEQLRQALLIAGDNPNRKIKVDDLRVRVEKWKDQYDLQQRHSIDESRDSKKESTSTSTVNAQQNKKEENVTNSKKEKARSEYANLQRMEEEWALGRIHTSEYVKKIEEVLHLLEEAGMNEEVKSLNQFLSKHK